MHRCAAKTKSGNQCMNKTDTKYCWRHSKGKGSKSPKFSKSPKSPKTSRSPRGCTLQHTKKYQQRRSPAYPANECCHQIKSRYGVNWLSKPDKNGVCRWVKM